MAKLQDSPANCGALALVNAMDAKGEKVTVATAETIAGTSAITGTGTVGMKRALRKLEKKAVEWEIESAGVAWSTLIGHLHQGQPVLMVVQEGEHWVVAVGTLGADRVLIVDSADGAVVVSQSFRQLMQWWRCGKSYYGIAVI